MMDKLTIKQRTNFYTIFLDDCMKRLKSMKDGTAIIITDPPDEVVVNQPEYFLECMRVSAGRMAWIVSDRTLKYANEYQPRPDKIIAWIPPSAQPTSGLLTLKYHPIACWGLHSGAKVATIRDDIEQSVWWSHPGTKPVSLMKKLIALFDNDVLIMDPFMGTGATGVACKELGRSYLGIESDPNYFEIATKRMKDTWMINE